MNLRILAIVALVIQPIVIGLGLVPAVRLAGGCDGACAAAATAEASCCGGDCAGDAPAAPCCVDVTGEGEPLAESACTCVPAMVCACPSAAPVQGRSALPPAPTVWAVRQGADRDGLTKLMWKALPAHTRVSLALAEWVVADDGPPRPVDDALSAGAAVRLARWCVWTI